MKKIGLLTGVIFAFALGAVAQNQCGHDHYENLKHADDPEWPNKLHEYMKRAISGETSGDRAGPYMIPVVVHIVHDGGDGNISHDQVLSGIQMLNDDYKRENADASSTRNTGSAPFAPEAVDMDISFALAKLDESGQCTNGVERRYSPAAATNTDDVSKHWSSGGLDQWDRWSYFNIWVVESINSGGSGTTLGYAYLPYGGIGSDFGVLIRHDVFGNIGTAGGDRTLTHEVGHSLGLLHTFQGGCTYSDCDDGGDYCCDTPPVVDPQWSCVTTQNTCTGVPTNDHYGFDAYDQFENFMSYSPCQNMFSNDQFDIVDYNMENIGIFTSMTSATNLTETGVALPDVLCEADFSYDTDLICAGSSIEFTDMSYANVTGWNWTFEGGTPATSTDPNPTVTYNTGGTYSVTLQVTDGVDFETKIETDVITVLNNPGDPLPYHEGFETLGSVPDNVRFMTVNDDGGQEWNKFSGVGSSGDNCVRLKNYGLGNGSTDELISGPIDLSGVDAADPMVFSFKYAYRRRSASNDETFRFYISKDCGETWALRLNKTGADLGPEIKSSSYTPEDASEWYEEVVDNITSSYYVSNFMYKFQFTNDQGNNIYIDDINLYPESMTDIENSHIANLTVYPNPVNNLLEIEMNLSGLSQATVTLHNALGQDMGEIFDGHVPAGTNKVTYSMADMPAGVYYVRVAYGTSTESIKVIKM